jgi:hypothetical protein
MVSVRDVSKIPANKLFEMVQCFFLIDFSVESEGGVIEVDDDGDEPDQNNTEVKLEDEDDLGDDFHALDKNKRYGGSNRMETDYVIHDAARGETMSRCVVPQDLEASVRNKVLGIEQSLIPAYVVVLRSAKDNIVKSLLQRFDAQIDDDNAKDNDTQYGVSVDLPAQPLTYLAWKEKKNWGHVQAIRMSSRIQRYGRSAFEKA